MATLETQYWNFLEKNPKSTLTFQEWQKEHFQQIADGIKSIEEKQEDYTLICPVCTGCGEDGCCKATMCQMSPDGSYCESYLKDLKIGYLMDEWVMENLYEQFTDEMKAAYDKKYDELIYEL
jgi:hypothetical protein